MWQKLIGFRPWFDNAQKKLRQSCVSLDGAMSVYSSQDKFWQWYVHRFTNYTQLYHRLEAILYWTSWCCRKPSKSDFWVQNRTFLRQICSQKSNFGPKPEKIRPCGNTGHAQAQFGISQPFDHFDHFNQSSQFFYLKYIVTAKIIDLKIDHWPQRKFLIQTFLTS